MSGIRRGKRTETNKVGVSGGGKVLMWENTAWLILSLSHTMRGKGAGLTVIG